MIEDVFNLGLALANVAITLLDPMLQLANGVDLYREASHTSPLVVCCPPRVQNGSWVCSDRRPLPACFLFCPSGLVPAGESQVDCETYRQDNTTNFSCVRPAWLSLEDWTSRMMLSGELKHFHKTSYLRTNSLTKR